MASSTLPDKFSDLLERPLFAHLSTVRPDGSPQSSVMWFAWDGSTIKMTHTKSRQKFANLANDPRVAISVADPDDQYRYVEVRGRVESVDDDDAQASFYKSLQKRYGMEYEITDAPERVIFTIVPESFVTVAGGSVQN
jgi:PPOX class probable F420-dependent enzyme